MITRAPRRGRNALRGRVRHGDFAAAFARAQAGGATVHLNAADVALPFTLMLLMWRPSPWPNTRSSVFAVFCHWVKRILGESLTCTPLLAETDAMVTHRSEERRVG